MPHFQITKVIMVHSNIENNDCQHDSGVLYTTAPIYRLIQHNIFLKTFNSEFSYIANCLLIKFSTVTDRR